MGEDTPVPMVRKVGGKKIPKMRHTSIRVPEAVEGVYFRLMLPHTGEIWECNDIAPLLRNIADEVRFAVPDANKIAIPARTYKLEILTR